MFLVANVNLSKHTINYITMENGQKSLFPPTKEQVRDWVKRDVTASSYFLSMMLRYPELLEELSDKLYEKILSEEQGALIDHMKKPLHRDSDKVFNMESGEYERKVNDVSNGTNK